MCSQDREGGDESSAHNARCKWVFATLRSALLFASRRAYGVAGAGYERTAARSIMTDLRSAALVSFLTKKEKQLARSPIGGSERFKRQKFGGGTCV
jgi:hypothetical protein